MTRVVNRRYGERGTKYVGRPSMLGNPFVIGRDGTRKEVVAKYEDYARKRMAEDEVFRAEVLACKDEVLECFCDPAPCHAHVLALLANEEDSHDRQG